MAIRSKLLAKTRGATKQYSYWTPLGEGGVNPTVALHSTGVELSRWRNQFNDGIAAWLFDHPIRLHQHPLRNGHTDFVGGFEIDYEIEFLRLLNRQIGWLCTFENLVDVGCGSTI
jgi:hypothetical protein